MEEIRFFKKTSNFLNTKFGKVKIQQSISDEGYNFINLFHGIKCLHKHLVYFLSIMLLFLNLTIKYIVLTFEALIISIASIRSNWVAAHNILLQCNTYYYNVTSHYFDSVYADLCEWFYLCWGSRFYYVLMFYFSLVRQDFVFYSWTTCTKKGVIKCLC